MPPGAFQAIPSLWHIPLTAFDTLDSVTNYREAITRAFSTSVSKQKGEIFFSRNLQKTQALVQRLEKNKVWSEQETLLFDAFVPDVQIFTAGTVAENSKTTLRWGDLTNYFKSIGHNLICQVNVGVQHKLVLYS